MIEESKKIYSLSEENKVKHHILRHIMRLRNKINDNEESKYLGVEEDAHWGFFTSGYHKGKLSAYEDIADLLEINIDE